MKFHVVPLSEDRAKEQPPLSKAFQVLAGPILLATPERPPIILCFDVIWGLFPGFENHQQVYLFNDVAWNACEGLGLKSVKTIGDADIPAKYGLLLGPQSAGYYERQFE